MVCPGWLTKTLTEDRVTVALCSPASKGLPQIRPLWPLGVKRGWYTTMKCDKHVMTGIQPSPQLVYAHGLAE